MTQEPFLPYAHQSIDQADLEAVSLALQGEWITRGPQVEAFESELAAYCGARYGVAFSSASAALAAAFYAAETGPHDRVVTTSNSFISTVGTAIQQGAIPVFVDIDRNTGNGDITQWALTVNQRFSRGKAILVPVHFSGIPVDMQKLNQMLSTPDVVIIEDAAHAIGSRYSVDGPHIGSCAWSHMTVFSFHPAKTMTTGEGGMVTTNDDTFLRRLRLYRNNCMERDPIYLTKPLPGPWYYEVVGLSNNYNFTDFQAALGRSQLKRLESFVAKRRELMIVYREALKDVPNLRLFTPEYDPHTAFHLCVAQIDFDALTMTKSEFMKELKGQGIGTQVHYIPLYRHPCIEKICGSIAEYFPETEAYYSQALSLPLYYDLTKEDVLRVADSLSNGIKKGLK